MSQVAVFGCSLSYSPGNLLFCFIMQVGQTRQFGQELQKRLTMPGGGSSMTFALLIFDTVLACRIGAGQTGG
jgi:hypothetical protein